MHQLWKDVRDYQGLYQVSNLGRVKSLNYRRTGKELIMTPVKNNCGYMLIKLFKKGCKLKTYTVHKLVFEAFYRRLLPNEDCHHINKCSTDNSSVNLVAKDEIEHIKEHFDGKKDLNTGKFTKATQ